MTPEDKAQAVVDTWREFDIGDEVIVTERCQIRSWAGLRGVIQNCYLSGGKPAVSVKLNRNDASLSFWTHELRHAD